MADTRTLYPDLDISLLEQLPPWYREILDYQEICDSEQTELDLLANAIRTVYNNFFLQTMDEKTVEEWERFFKILPSVQSWNYRLGIWELGAQSFGSYAAAQSESLDYRRQRILNRISTRPPFTLSFLYQKLDEMIGRGMWTVTVDYANYTLYISSNAENQQYATELGATIGRIKPAHIVYISNPIVTAGVLASETIDAAARSWNCHLGTWTLSGAPFLTDYPPEVVKVADTPSVQQRLLNSLTTYTANQIVAARINGSAVISAITKTVADNLLTVKYHVTPSITQTVTRAELIDSDGNALVSSAVYVPVTSDELIMEHKIPIKEGL